MSTADPGHSAARDQGDKTPWSSCFICNCKGILAMKMIVVHVIKVVVLVVKINIQCMVCMALKRRKSCSGDVVVMCSMKKANRNKFNTIVRQCAIHVVGMI